jgi:hypothetical protein
VRVEASVGQSLHPENCMCNAPVDHEKSYTESLQVGSSVAKITPSTMRSHCDCARVSGVMFQSPAAIQGPLRAPSAAAASCSSSKLASESPSECLRYTVKLLIPPFRTALIHARESLCLEPSGMALALSGVMPVPFLARMAPPPEPMAVPAWWAFANTGFHPSLRASLLAETSALSEKILDSWQSTMSAPDRLRTACANDFHEFPFAESMAKSPSLGHHLSASLPVGGQAGLRFSSA